MNVLTSCLQLFPVSGVCLSHFSNNCYKKGRLPKEKLARPSPLNQRETNTFFLPHSNVEMTKLPSKYKTDRNYDGDDVNIVNIERDINWFVVERGREGGEAGWC